MNKLLSVLAVSFFLGIAVVKADPQSSFDGWTYTEVDVASGVVFNGLGRVGSVYASSDVPGGRDWFVICDTPGGSIANGSLGAGSSVGSAFPASYPSSVRVSPPMYFVTPSTPMSGGTNGSFPTGTNMSKVLDFGEYGVKITSACFVGKTAAASGEARKVGLLWRK